ncbi:DUF2142 domain-containing protein [Clostridiaceae bacterium DONG20-135]|uniref:DUF2142 domain-containing protein n=1 Tax=Copranaerobaculum intestinale TaxID=2692629 RepID=A0A6N8U4W5_9FIRM|nr:DUF2142 domain-containing protein [Copranaerobaculum intestinale]MXQ72990.1 DUF2142 domain-containing protein [Copranaerobaculum intestinale]
MAAYKSKFLNYKKGINTCLVFISFTVILGLLFFMNRSEIVQIDQPGYSVNKNEIHEETLSRGKTLDIPFDIKMNRLDSLKLELADSRAGQNVHITVLKDHNKLYEEDIDLGITKGNIELNHIDYGSQDIRKKFQMEVRNDSEQPIKFLVSYDDNDQANILFSYSGQNKIYHQTILTGLLIILLIVLSTFILFNFNVSTSEITNIIFQKLKKLKLSYILEVMLFLTVILLLMSSINYYFYYQMIKIPIYIGLIIVTPLFISYMVNLILMAKKDLSKIFVIIALPICMLYMFLIIPNAVPDEVTHFGKAYLTSTFCFTNENHFYVPEAYSNLTHYDYGIFYQNLFSNTNYDEVVKSTLLTSYNSVYYMIPAAGIFIGRVLNLSITGAFLMGRFFNALLFIGLGSLSIKKVPYAKLLFFVYLLSPMMIQEAVSMSIDCMINAVTIFVIAYILEMKFKNDRIATKDIVILGSLFVVILLGKYNYLPVFGLLLILPSLKKLTKKQWLYVLGFLCLGPILYFIYSRLLTAPSSGVSSSAGYILETGVNTPAQVNLVLHNPIYFIKVMLNTLLKSGEFYFYSFIGRPLSWLNVDVYWALIFVYFIAMFLSIYIGKTKYYLKKFEKAWILVLSAIMVIGIFFALYITWTGVGGDIILGVQGRYFIPIVILLLLLLKGKSVYNLHQYEYKYTSFILIFHCLVAYCIFLGFV